jgi:hypothetical protein
MIHRRTLLAAFAVSLALTPAAPALARSKSRHAAMGSWDGRWAGAWGGKDATAINVSGGRVVSYEYNGTTNPVASSRMTPTRIVYGENDIVVALTRTGRDTAHATIKTSQGNGVAELRR